MVLRKLKPIDRSSDRLFAAIFLISASGIAWIKAEVLPVAICILDFARKNKYIYRMNKLLSYKIDTALRDKVMDLSPANREALLEHMSLRNGQILRMLYGCDSSGKLYSPFEVGRDYLAMMQVDARDRIAKAEQKLATYYQYRFFPEIIE